MINNKKSLLEIYDYLGKQSKSLATVKVRKSLFTLKLVSHLESYGGIYIWIATIFLAILGIFIFSDTPYLVGEIVAICCGAYISYLVSLFTFNGAFKEFHLTFHGYEDDIESRALKLFFNGVTIFVLPILMFFSLVVLSFISLQMTHQVLSFIALFSTFAFLLSQLLFTWRNLVDYVDIFSVLTGKKSVIFRDTDSLLNEIKRVINNLQLEKSQLDSLSDFSESDRRHAEVRLELTNLVLAVLAILFSVLLVDRLVPLYLSILFSLDEIFLYLSQSISHLLGLLGLQENLFVSAIRIGIWWLLINALLGIGFYILQGLLSIYYYHYRPVYLLHHAILQVRGEVTSSASFRNETFIQKIIITLRRIFFD